MAISNSAIVILGASGDLARRKLMPALARLYSEGFIDNTTVIIGSGRTAYSTPDFQARFNLPENFRKLVYYHQGTSGIKNFISGLGVFNQVIFFLALPPAVYAKTAAALAAEGFARESRLIIEKPFGYNYSSAREINENLLQYFNEEQFFRIDHYLAKEAVQNILVFRYANSIFYPIWNSGYVKCIQVNAFEDIGIIDRGKYFDNAGIIRDMVQNHLFQLLSLLTMEAPVSLQAEDIRFQKINLLKSMEIVECHRYQYKGYRQEKDVAPDSTTETYAEIKLMIHNFRWHSMPVYIKVGKALNRKGTEIGFLFKKLPRLLFNKDGEVSPNRIIFKIQPAEGIIVDISSKIPGSDFKLTGTNLTFCFRDYFKDKLESAYRKLLFDALNGDSTLFVSKDEVETAWQKLAPVLDRGELQFYDQGTVPRSSLDVEWIDFDNYKSACE